jgi:hypothetical protein
MRNLLVYPLTGEEVLTSLDLAREEQVAKQFVGDLVGYSLYTVHDFLQRHPDILKQMTDEAANQITGA